MTCNSIEWTCDSPCPLVCKPSLKRTVLYRSCRSLCRNWACNSFFAIYIYTCFSTLVSQSDQHTHSATCLPHSAGPVQPQPSPVVKQLQSYPSWQPVSVQSLLSVWWQTCVVRHWWLAEKVHYTLDHHSMCEEENGIDNQVCPMSECTIFLQKKTGHHTGHFTSTQEWSVRLSEHVILHVHLCS